MVSPCSYNVTKKKLCLPFCVECLDCVFAASYREASVEVIEVMSRFAVIERASIDEAYMDLTSSVQKRLKDLEVSQIDPQLLKNTYVQGFPVPEEDGLLDKGVLVKPCEKSSL